MAKHFPKLHTQRNCWHEPSQPMQQASMEAEGRNNPDWRNCVATNPSNQCKAIPKSFLGWLEGITSNQYRELQENTKFLGAKPYFNFLHMWINPSTHLTPMWANICKIFNVSIIASNQTCSTQGHVGPQTFPKVHPWKTYGTSLGPWLPSGSNFHNHQKSALGPTSTKHGQQFSQTAPLKKIMAQSMCPGCQVAALFTTIKTQHWPQQIQSMPSNFPKLHPWRKP